MGLELSGRLQQLKLAESERNKMEAKLTEIYSEQDPKRRVVLQADFAAMIKPYFRGEQRPVAWEIYKEVILYCQNKKYFSI